MLVYDEYYWGGVNNYSHHLLPISVHRPSADGVDLPLDWEDAPSSESNF